MDIYRKYEVLIGGDVNNVKKWEKFRDIVKKFTNHVVARDIWVGREEVGVAVAEK